MFKMFKRIFRRHCYKVVGVDEFTVLAYSQDGEDLLLRRFMENQNTGFYVDVGALHPKRFSNTYFFYKLGWHGINIDAMPGSMDLFNEVRPRDTNLECPVGPDNQTLTYYMFNEPALNGFDKNLSQSRHEQPAYHIVATKEMQVKSLSTILNEYVPQGTKIDFMSVDVEGLDLEVLKSNDWDRYSPTYVLAEVLGTSFEELGASEVTQYLHSKGYILIAKTCCTAFFEKKR